jgi:hypothetical protein
LKCSGATKIKSFTVLSESGADLKVRLKGYKRACRNKLKFSKQCAIQIKSDESKKRLLCAGRAFK